METKYCCHDSLTELADTCTRIAVALEKDPDHQSSLCGCTSGLGVGYIGLMGKLLNGVAALAELRMELVETKSRLAFARGDARAARDTLEELVGDRNIDSLNEENYAKVVEFLNKSDVKALVHQLGDEEEQEK